MNPNQLTGFDRSVAIQMAQASNDAYDSSLHDGEVLDERYDLRATVRDAGDYIIGAFRGTKSLMNWAIDVYALPNIFGWHTGFYDAWMQLRAGVLLKIAALPKKPIFLGGHSLGGALAATAAKDIPCGGIYTFGQPRVCKPGAIFSSAPHFRFVDKEDIIPHVPGLLAGYRHRGNLILLDSFGSIEVNPSECRQIAMHAIGLAGDIQRIATGKMPEWVAIKEHYMSNYLSFVKNLPADLCQKSTSNPVTKECSMSTSALLPPEKSPLPS